MNLDPKRKNKYRITNLAIAWFFLLSAVADWKYAGQVSQGWDVTLHIAAIVVALLAVFGPLRAALSE